MAEIDKLLEKIQKLLALSSSPHQNEAESAMAKAYELMTLNNISIQDLEEATQEREGYVEEIAAESERSKSSDAYVIKILNDFFNVACFAGVSKARRATRYQPGYKGVNRVKIAGKASDVEVARYVYAFLTASYSSMFNDYVNSFKKGSFERKQAKEDRHGFYVGVTKGLREKLEQSKHKIEQEHGLILVKNTDLIPDNYIRNKGGRCVSTSRKITLNHSSTGAGYAAGQSINILKPIANGSNSVKLLG